MKKSVIVFIVSTLFAAPFIRAAEMFESYPKNYSLGYVADAVNFRYWFNSTWGLDTSVGFEKNNTKNKTDDGITQSNDYSNSNNYTFSLAAVRTLKNYQYFDLNFKAGASYEQGKAKDDPDGPNNVSVSRTKSYSLAVGPEIEIKLPYFSRLVIVSSIQAVYRHEKQNVNTEMVGGATSTIQEANTFTLLGDGNSLDELFHIGARYYF